VEGPCCDRPEHSSGRPAARPSSVVAAVGCYLAGRRGIERVCFLVGVLLIASGIVHVGVLVVRGGPLYGPVSFRKPMTFGVSFRLSLVTVAWLVSFLRLGSRVRSVLLGVFAVDCVVEVTGITVQAWRRVPSHFNTVGPLNRVIAMSLAAGGAVLVVVLGTFAFTAIRGRVEGPPDLVLAMRAGFGLLVVGLGTGVAMIVKGEVLIGQGHRQQAYDTAGSLKWVHGVSLHAVLVLPVLAVLLAHRGWATERRARAVLVATGLYVAATLTALVISLA
jgi:hypothetical protein